MNMIRKTAIWILNLSRNSGGAEIYLLKLAGILRENSEVILLCDRCENDEETVHRALELMGMPGYEVFYIDDPSVTDRSKFLAILKINVGEAYEASFAKMP